ncbi:hypothetical protein BpHYR1_040520 [Brachionus plicatilis]|uniref:Uncharacterized protein n=1 Tax=Brachionus plicatilis TaxID=10195 RepID=A0A3M7T0Z3_BRAPC|nr:hypothetical protein BpHYR1_040520 [Brachionus plicatilis]
MANYIYCCMQLKHSGYMSLLNIESLFQHQSRYKLYSPQIEHSFIYPCLCHPFIGVTSKTQNLYKGEKLDWCKQRKA